MIEQGELYFYHNTLCFDLLNSLLPSDIRKVAFLCSPASFPNITIRVLLFAILPE